MSGAARKPDADSKKSAQGFCGIYLKLAADGWSHKTLTLPSNDSCG